MIEEGKTYKIKKIKGLDTNEDPNNTATVLKIVNSSNKELGDIAFCNVNGERYVLPVHALMDPENPEEYSKWSVTKLESVMRPMDLHFWKDLQEEATFSALGAAPCPAMGQVMGTTVNGIPVEGKSVKKKKKKKHETHKKTISGTPLGDINHPHVSRNTVSDNIILKNLKESVEWIDRDGVEHVELDQTPSTTLDDIDREEYVRNLEKTGWMDTPKQIFQQNRGQTDDPEFEDAINILLFGGMEDKQEYEELIELFCECGRFGDFARLASEKYGLELKDLDSSNIGKDIDEAFEIKWLDEDFHEAYERITNLLAKQLDRMNFEYANTEEIIYKKEGAYRYLLKFDNEIGILKFKVTKDDATIIEKEWQLDEKEDVSPIFAEIEDIYNKYGI